MRLSFRQWLVVSLGLNLALLAVPVAMLVHKGGFDYVLEKTGLRPPEFHPQAWQERWVDWVKTLPQRDDDVLFVGDSLVADGRWSEYFPHVRNRGIGGQTAAGILHHIEEIVHPRARKVFVLVGTNDLSAEMTAAQAAADYRQVLERIRRACPTAGAYALSVLPVNTDVRADYLARAKQDRIVELNALIERLCRDTGSTYLDIRRPFLDPRGMLDARLTTDGLHLNAAGYAVFYREMAPYMAGDRQMAEVHETPNAQPVR